MNVLHLSTSDVRGGAARGAYWLHQSLRGLGVESRMLVGRKHSDDPSVDELGGLVSGAGEKLRSMLDQLPLRGYHKTNEAFWTVGWQPRDVTGAVANCHPDLIHIHWTGGGFLPVRALSQLSAPVVWTMRDMWAFTGGCHYTSGCNRYQLRCGHCPQLNSRRENDLSRQVWNNKSQSWRNLDLWVVTISEWLAQCARQSELFVETPITVIPNGVDIRRFRPRSRDEARAALGLAPDRNYILFGALGALSDERKGFKELVAALRQFEGRPEAANAELVIFGDVGDEAMPDLAIPTRFFGTINDDEKLAALYAAADVMVAPSLQEAFGKTLIEAMACGTPVVAFDHGGPAEIIDHKIDGYLAAAFEPAALADGIAWCLAARNEGLPLGTVARQKVEAKFDAASIGQRYLDHYRKILARPA